MPSIAGSVGIARQSMLHPNSREMRFDMAATDRITPIDESEVAVNESAGSECSEPTRAVRRHLPDERRALTHHFSIAGQEGYLTVECTRMGCQAKSSSPWRSRARPSPG